MTSIRAGLALALLLICSSVSAVGLGIDMAWGPEDTAVYLTVGHNWQI